MEEKGYSWSQAKYASEPGRRASGKDYRPIERRAYSPDDPMFKNYRLQFNPIKLCWELFNNKTGRQKKISLVTTK